MKEPKESSGERQAGWLRRNALPTYVGVVGAVLLGMGATFSFLDRGDAAAAALALLGATAMILAPLIPRIEEFQVTPTGIKGKLRRQAVRRVREAPEGTLEGILPLLVSEEAAVRMATVPARFSGQRLTKELRDLRPDLLLSVVALQEPDGRWTVGGVIADRPLHEGQRMLVAGPEEIVESFTSMIWEADDTRFQRELAELKSRAKAFKTAGPTAE